MKRTPILHPILLALFPVLALLAANRHQFRLEVLWAPALGTAGAALAGWLILTAVLKNARKAGLIVSLFAVLFFSYAHLVGVLPQVTVAAHGIKVGTPHMVAGAAIAALAVGAYLAVRTRNDLFNLTRILNFTAAILVVIPSLRIASYQMRNAARADDRPTPVSRGRPAPSRGQPHRPPDIYYIILDGYAGADVLRTIFNYDNTPFLQYLADKGFFVAGRSRSNYSQTVLSLASCLNMQYLDGLMRGVNPESSDNTQYAQFIAKSEFVRLLKERGYRFAAFSSGYYLTDVKSADLYFASGSLDEFERGVIGATPLAATGSSWKEQREIVEFALDHLADTTDCVGPLFVFAHIVAPHPPFVFGPDGEEITPMGEFTMADGSHLVGLTDISWDEYRRGYLAQLQYVNKRMRGVIDSILSRSRTDPVIIIQGDHGPGSLLDQESAERTCLTERFSILNAYRLPGAAGGYLYDAITPVNTFRVLLNRYFSADYELLPDECYFTTWSKPFKYIRVTDALEKEDVPGALARAKLRPGAGAPDPSAPGAAR